MSDELSSSSPSLGSPPSRLVFILSSVSGQPLLPLHLLLHLMNLSWLDSEFLRRLLLVPSAADPGTEGSGERSCHGLGASCSHPGAWRSNS